MPVLTRTRGAALWWVLLFVGAVGVFAVSLSGTVYDATSPDWLTGHAVLRKIYAVASFTGVAYLLCRAGRPAWLVASPVLVAVAIGCYSAAIELCQRVVGAHETLALNVLDVGIGVIGGVFGWLAARRAAGS